MTPVVPDFSFKITVRTDVLRVNELPGWYGGSPGLKKGLVKIPRTCFLLHWQTELGEPALLRICGPRAPFLDLKRRKTTFIFIRNQMPAEPVFRKKMSQIQVTGC